MSSLKIKLKKCGIIPIGEVEDIEVFTLLNCKIKALPTTYLGLPLGASNKDQIGALPITYLGLPLGTSNKDRTIWNPVLQRVEKKLAGCQKRYMSKRWGKVCIKSMVSRIPTRKDFKQTSYGFVRRDKEVPLGKVVDHHDSYC